jgi:hypothetical protein
LEFLFYPIVLFTQLRLTVVVVQSVLCPVEINQWMWVWIRVFTIQVVVQMELVEGVEGYFPNFVLMEVLKHTL